MKATGLLGALVLAFVICPATPGLAQDVGIDIGKVPPAVAIEDLAGNAVDLRQYIGRTPVLIEFWAEWCDVCDKLHPRLDAAARQYAGKAEVLVVAVAVNQSKRSVRRHAERHPMPGRLLWDTSGRATRAFEAPSTSYVVVLDAKGRVTYTGVGADQDLADALRRAVNAK